MAAAHRIGRVHLRLSAADRAEADAVTGAFTNRFADEVLGPLEAAFDRIDQGGAVIRLERLHLNLGRLDPANPGFADRLRAALEQELGANLPAGAASPRAQADELANFLATGALAWPQPGAALDEFAAAMLLLSAHEMAALAHRLLPLLADRAIALRFLLQLPLALHLNFAAVFVGPAADGAAPAHGIPAPSRHLTADEAEALAPLLVALARSRGAASEAAAFRAARSSPTLPTGAALPRALPALPTRDRNRAQQPAKPPSAPVRTDLPRATAPEQDRLAITAAGAVLLHPFLAPFFGALELAKDGVFRDAAAQQQAVLFGHFLATGETSPAEPDCLLMKLLCGLPLAAPLPRAASIDAKVEAEAHTLLAAVISHWGRLGATSPEGLREGFLRRPGLLALGDGAPVLNVERRTIDVLLDRLPWTISRIRTPFMDRVLAVEWIV